MKYRYIIHWFFTPRDSSGNVYSYFAIADTRSGRIMHGKDACESNLRGVPFFLNGKQHQQNYWFAQTQIPWRTYVHNTKTIEYIGCDSAELAEKFRKVMKSRKRKA
jgi:hypothetical protein